MPKSGPIIVVEDDSDDQELLKEVFEDIQISNQCIFFNTCHQVLAYLLITTDKPLIIISDINLPMMTGLQLRREINENEFLRRKSIPFIFLTTNSDKKTIQQAYEMMVQGYFVKPSNIREIKEMMKMIIDYWKICKHPNSE